MTLKQSQARDIANVIGQTSGLERRRLEHRLAKLNREIEAERNMLLRMWGQW